MVHIDQARFNILRVAGISAIAFGFVLLISAAAVPTHEEHYCYLKDCVCYNNTSTNGVCRKWRVSYWIGEGSIAHDSNLPVCPRGNPADGFVCWTDSDGNDLHIVSPAERTMTNLVTASFTFSVSGILLLFPTLIVKLLVIEGDESSKLSINTQANRSYLSDNPGDPHNDL